MERKITNESGTFIVDENGILTDFNPSESNPIVDGKYEINSHYTYTALHSIKNLIIPEGVKGFSSDSFSRLLILNELQLPDSLESIGDKQHNPVFSNCIIKKLVIPEKVKTLGDYAFGSSHIEELTLPASIRSPYGRQFKDSHICRLKLPKEFEDLHPIAEYSRIHFDLPYNKMNEYGWLNWPSTKVDEFKFY